MLFVAVAEATFWLEFSTRFNFIAVDYLLYTHEVIGNIRESYPVLDRRQGSQLRRCVSRSHCARGCPRRPLPTSLRRRLGYVVAAISLPAVALTVASIEQMGTIGNAYADELAGNGIFTFFAAVRRNELDYDELYSTMTQDEADAC